MYSSRTTYLFAGPTLYGVAPNCAGLSTVALLPPAKRGDIDALVRRETTPSTLILADGFFYSELSVSHAELRRALRAGWDVIGVSSIGAIRACEMLGLGMKGFGDVFHRFATEPDFSDDEVALLHTPRPPYYPGSEPMVHVREYLNALVREGAIDRSRSEDVVGRFKNRWFGDRTVEALSALIGGERCDPVIVERELTTHRVKTRDLVKLLGERSEAAQRYA